MGFVFVVFLFIFMISAAIGIALYILNGFGLMELAKTCSEKYPYLSFVPYASTYLTGKLAFNSKKSAIIYLVSQIALLVIYYIAYFGLSIAQEIFELDTHTTSIAMIVIPFLFSLVLLAITSVAMYKLYKRFSEKYVILTTFTVLTGGMLAPIFIFAIRKNKILRY